MLKSYLCRCWFLMAAFLLVLLPVTVIAPPAQSAGLTAMPTGECDISSSSLATTPCASGTQYAGVGPALAAGTYTATAIGARSIAGTSAYTAIDAWGTARYIDNSSGNSIFLPFNSSTEWLAFLHNMPAGISAVPAAVPATATYSGLVVEPGGTAPNNCVSPSPASYPIPVPYYARPSTQIPAPFTESFTCTVKGLCGTGHPTCGADQTWTQTAHITYVTAPTADSTGKVPWSILTSYSGTAPTPAPAPQDGACSSGRGGCSVGSTLGLRNSGYTWYWTCSGVNGGESSDLATGGNLCSDTDGSCGGAAFSCGTGNPANGSDSGSTSSWSCTGINGGVTVNNCSACDPGYVLINGSCELPIAGQCGGNDWSCNAGNAVNGSSDGNNDYWYCTGTNTGAESPQCRFALAKNGQCGGNDGSCVVGNPVGQSSDSSNDYWYCSGVNGGGNSGQCSYGKRVNGVCNYQSNYTQWYICGSGGATAGASNVSFNPNQPCLSGTFENYTETRGNVVCVIGQNWICAGANGGASATCQGAVYGPNYDGMCNNSDSCGAGGGGGSQ